jgi:hypothetical protein
LKREYQHTIAVYGQDCWLAFDPGNYLVLTASDALLQGLGRVQHLRHPVEPGMIESAGWSITGV